MIKQSPQGGSSLKVREILEAVGKGNAGLDLQKGKGEASESRDNQNLPHC